MYHENFGNFPHSLQIMLNGSAPSTEDPRPSFPKDNPTHGLVMQFGRRPFFLNINAFGFQQQIDEFFFYVI